MKKIVLFILLILVGCSCPVKNTVEKPKKCNLSEQIKSEREVIRMIQEQDQKLIKECQEMRKKEIEQRIEDRERINRIIRGIDWEKVLNWYEE